MKAKNPTVSHIIVAWIPFPLPYFFIDGIVTLSMTLIYYLYLEKIEIMKKTR